MGKLPDINTLTTDYLDLPRAHPPEDDWNICATYMRDGYLPPLVYCNLPASTRDIPAHAPLTDRERWVLAGARKACEVQIERVERQCSWIINNLDKIGAP